MQNPNNPGIHRWITKDKAKKNTKNKDLTLGFLGIVKNAVSLHV